MKKNPKEAGGIGGKFVGASAREVSSGSRSWDEARGSRDCRSAERRQSCWQRPREGRHSCWGCWQCQNRSRGDSFEGRSSSMGERWRGDGVEEIVAVRPLHHRRRGSDDE